MANIEEFKSIFTNNTLGYQSSSRALFITPATNLSSTFTGDKIYYFGGASGAIFINANISNLYTYCIRKE